MSQKRLREHYLLYEIISVYFRCMVYGNNVKFTQGVRYVPIQFVTNKNRHQFDTVRESYFINLYN